MISKANGKVATTASELEKNVAKALYDIQSSNEELAGELTLLQIRGAREIELQGGRKAILIMVPVPQLKSWRRIQPKILRELEKKLGSGGEKSVLLIAFRRIIAKPKRCSKVTRPRSRTLTAVHEAWLEDMCYPTEIVGKRIRVKTDGSRLMKVILDHKDQTTIEGKTEVMASVYRKLTGKDVAFEFSTATTTD